MTAGQLRAALADLPDWAPVLVDSDPWPLEITDTTSVIVSTAAGGMVRGIALVPEASQPW